MPIIIFKNLGKIIHVAMQNDWIRGNPLKNFKVKLEDVDKEFLTRSELDTLIDRQFLHYNLKLLP